MSQEPLETEYPDLTKMSRAERDNYLFQALLKIGNEVARINKVVQELKSKV